MNELKPCPFCGSCQIEMQQWTTLCNAACCNCDAEGPIGLSKAEAIEKWNDRKGEDDAVQEFDPIPMF